MRSQRGIRTRVLLLLAASVASAGHSDHVDGLLTALAVGGGEVGGGLAGALVGVGVSAPICMAEDAQPDRNPEGRHCGALVIGVASGLTVGALGGATVTGVAAAKALDRRPGFVLVGAGTGLALGGVATGIQLLTSGNAEEAFWFTALAVPLGAGFGAGFGGEQAVVLPVVSDGVHGVRATMRF